MTGLSTLKTFYVLSAANRSGLRLTDVASNLLQAAHPTSAVGRGAVLIGIGLTAVAVLASHPSRARRAAGPAPPAALEIPALLHIRGGEMQRKRTAV